MRTFTTAAEFGAALDEAMLPGLADTDMRRQLAAGLEKAEVELREEADPDSGEGLNLRIGRFVLREEDLPVVEAIGIVSAAAVALLAPAAVAAGIIAVVGNFAAMTWKAWRKGARLSPNEIKILGLLEIHGPLDAEELLRLAAQIDPGLTPETVDRALATLGDVEMRDGDIVSLVRVDASGRLCARAG